MSPYQMFTVRPLLRGWAVYCLGEPVTPATSRHDANLIWSRFIEETYQNRVEEMISSFLKAA